MAQRGENKLDTIKVKHEIHPYCSPDISKVYSKEGILSRPFQVAELSSPNKIHVHLRTYVDFLGGYANHGRNILFGLNSSGETIVKLTPIPSPVDIDPMTHQKCNFLINNPAFDIDKSVFVCIAGPGFAQKDFVPKNRYSIMWTMIESMCCHPDMKEWLSNVKEVWAPTFVDADRFKGLDLPNIKLMRLGYDENMYNPLVRAVDIENLRGRYVFMVLGSWNKRKGIKEIIRAFCRAFTPRDNVSLMLFCKYGTRPYDGIKDGEKVSKETLDKFDISYEFKKYTQDFKEIPHISLCDVPVHENVMPNVAARAQCIVGASMGESTWLPGLELMAMGKPVIQLASQCSGFMDYLDDGNSYLCKKVTYVDADEELYKGTSEYYEGQQFAQADEFELSEMMLRVYREKNSDQQQYKITRGLDRVRDWTWKKSVEKVIDRLKEIVYDARIHR